MAHEEHSSSFTLGDVFHLTDGFLLELGVADSKDFVHDEDFGFKEGRYGEAQTDSHSRGITFDRGVDITFATGEIDDLVQLGLDLITRHAKDSAVHEDILTPRHLPVEACADLKKGANTTVGTDSAGRGACDAAEELQQRTLAGTVLADDADHIALLDLEIDVAQRPDVFGVAACRSIIGFTNF